VEEAKGVRERSNGTQNETKEWRWGKDGVKEGNGGRCSREGAEGKEGGVRGTGLRGCKSGFRINLQ
jgi:hypothetical protein